MNLIDPADWPEALRAELAQAWHDTIAPFALQWLAPLSPILLTISALLVWRRVATLRRAYRDARRVVIRPAQESGPDDVDALWRRMAGLLRQRVGGWRPHVALQFEWANDRLTLSFWTPGVVSAEQIRRVVESSMPGATATVERDRLPRASELPTVAGGYVAPIGGRDHLPLKHDQKTDPLRGIYNVGAYLRSVDCAILRISVRPAGRRRIARARQIARGDRSTAPAGQRAAVSIQDGAYALIRFVVVDIIGELLRPDSAPPPDSPRPDQPSAGQIRRDPVRQAEMRATADKLTDTPLWEVAIHYGVGVHLSGRDARRSAKWQASDLGAEFGVFSCAVQLMTHRTPFIAGSLTRPRMRHAFLVSTPELVALAHPPYDPTSVPCLPPPEARPIRPPTMLDDLLRRLEDRSTRRRDHGGSGDV